MKSCLLLLLLCSTAVSAHVISMSSGEAVVTGNRLAYTLRMPDYEIANLRHPEQTLLDRIVFTSNSEKPRRTTQECHHDPASVNLICTASYEFPSPVQKLGVDCSFYEVTVPNHIHILRAHLNGKSDRAILDSGFHSTTLTFRPPTSAEKAIEQLIAGMVNTASNWSALLLLAALAFAARTRLELTVLCLAYLVTDTAVVFTLPHLASQPAPRLAEQAAALAISYLAVEIFFFPNSRFRWLFALLFGTLAPFLTEARYPTGFNLAGSAATVLFSSAIFGALAIAFAKFRLTRIAAVLLFAAAVVRFAISLLA